MVIQQEMIEKNVVTCEKAITDCGKKALINARAPCRYVFEIAIVRVLSRTGAVRIPARVRCKIGPCPTILGPYPPSSRHLSRQCSATLLT